MSPGFGRSRLRRPRLRTRFAQLRLNTLESRLAPASFQVLNPSDSGPGSLRDAIAMANASPGTDDISFSPAITSLTPIVLTAGELSITDSVNITGTSPTNIVIDGGGQ